MSMSDREQRAFLDEDPEKQFEEARTELFRLSNEAKTLEDSLYFWTAVYASEGRGGRWGGGNPTANLVRRMMQKEYFDPFYLDNNHFDDVAYTTDLSIVRETLRQEKKEGGGAARKGFSAVENIKPQLHEYPLEVIVTMKALILEILSVCSYAEKRLFAFILVENNLNDFLELFEDRKVLGDLDSIMEELYARIREEEGKRERRDQRARALQRVGKRKFVTQGKNKRAYNILVESFEKKVRPLFFLDE